MRVKAEATGTHTIRAPDGHSISSKAWCWSKKATSPHIQGGDINPISPVCWGIRNCWWLSLETIYCIPSSSHHLILSSLPNTEMCIFELLQYICHKLVVIYDSCLSPTPTIILWFSLHLGTDVCASNITSLFGGTIFGHIKMLPEHNFFVNRVSSNVQFFPILQDSVKSDFFHKLFIDPPEKDGISLFLKFIAMYFWNL